MVRHLYVHTPFCAKICPYCAFYVHQGGAAAQREFVAALRTEWLGAREEFPLELETIYFGGGTPSILSAELFAELAELIPRSEVAVGPADGSKGTAPWQAPSSEVAVALRA